MSTTEFTPERSAAIRQLLIDTVADEPHRRKRLQILLTSVLSGVALVLAGGTAALALSGVIHLGGETPPAPVPTPTQTVTPTPTPTPTPTATPATIAVQAGPIAPRDVTSLPGKPSWSLDVPAKGDPCGQRSFTDIADGLTLVQTGPAEVGDDGTGCDPVNQNVQLSLVDTISGSVKWTRSWSWAERSSASVGGTVVQTTVLGTSGKVLVFDQQATGGPHEVVRLTDGSSLGTFDAGPPTDGFLAPQAVQDGSGDVVLALSNPGGQASVERVNPLDAGHPVWSTPVPAAYVSAFIAPGDTLGRARVAYTQAGGPSTNVPIDVSTGRLGSAVDDMLLIDGTDIRLTRTPDGTTARAYGADPDQPLWTRQLPADTQLRQVGTAANLPGAAVGVHPSAGYVAAIASGRMTLIDANSGEDVWSLGADSCFGTAITKYGTNPTVDAQGATLMIAGDGVLCRVGLTTGDELPAVRFDQPLSGMPFFGTSQFYTSSYRDAGGDVEAYDIRSGQRVWAEQLGRHEGLMFLGGTLVKQVGDHLESVG